MKGADLSAQQEREENDHREKERETPQSECGELLESLCLMSAEEEEDEGDV